MQRGKREKLYKNRRYKKGGFLYQGKTDSYHQRLEISIGMRNCINKHCHKTVTTPIYSPAAATAKLLQSCQTLCDPIDGSPPGSPVPGILQARTLEWVAISFSNARK